MQRRYTAPGDWEPFDKLERARNDLKIAKNRLLVEKKISKHRLPLLRAKLVHLHAQKKEMRRHWKNLRRLASKIDDWSNGLVDVEGALEPILSRAKNHGKLLSVTTYTNLIHSAVEESRGIVHDRKEAETLVRCLEREELYQKTRVERSQAINTTIDNARSVQHVADYFSDMGGERVFVDAVRPFCLNAIRSPEQMRLYNREASVCIECPHRFFLCPVFCTNCHGSFCSRRCERQHYLRCPVALDKAARKVAAMDDRDALVMRRVLVEKFPQSTTASACAPIQMTLTGDNMMQNPDSDDTDWI